MNDCENVLRVLKLQKKQREPKKKYRSLFLRDNSNYHPTNKPNNTSSKNIIMHVIVHLIGCTSKSDQSGRGG